LIFAKLAVKLDVTANFNFQFFRLKVNIEVRFKNQL